jgi:conjugal transfer pilus assembly protein TraB
MENNAAPTKVTTDNDLKNRRYYYIGGGLTVVFLLAYFLVKIIHPAPPPLAMDPAHSKKVTMNAFAIPEKTSEDKWIAEGETRLTKNEMKLKEMQEQIQRMQVQNNPVAFGNQGVANGIIPQAPQGSTPISSPSPNGSVKGLPPQKDFPAFEKAAPVVVPSQNGGASMSNATPVSLNNDGMGIKVISNESPNSVLPGGSLFGKEEKKEEAKKEESKVNVWMPTGSFMPGVLLSGLDAPTGGQSQTNPHPVLIRIEDQATLPNRFREDIKECFIVGAGYGDISSERAYIRTETLSCVMKNGRTLDHPIKGFIAGEDGKNGMRGRLVSKEGQIIAKALLAGFASGVGSAFQASTVTQSISPLGTTQTVDPNKALQAGAYSGVASSMNMLAAHYIKLAEQTFPIIEVDAGRKIDVVITKGFEINLDGTSESNEKEK